MTFWTIYFIIGTIYALIATNAAIRQQQQDTLSILVGSITIVLAFFAWPIMMPIGLYLRWKK